MFTITCDTRRAVVGQKELITSRSAGIGVQFSFSDDYTGLAKTAVFRNGDDPDTKIDVALTEEFICTIPVENCAEEYIDEPIFCGVYATDGNGTVIIPTIWVSLGTLREGVKPGNAEGADPTPDMWAQIIALAQEAGAENAAIAEAAAQAILDMAVAAGTLSAGSEATVTKTVDPETGAVTLTFGIPAGEPGEDGSDGQDGQDGYSPTVTVTTIAGGHRVTITDAQGDHTFDVMDGQGGGDAGDITFDDTETYPSGTVGSELSDLNQALTLKEDKLTIVTKLATDEAQTLAADTFYIFPEMDELAITCPVTGLYGFRFTSGTTPTVFTIAGPTQNDVIVMPDDWEGTEASMTYEMSILNGYCLVSKWEVSGS